MYLPDGSYCKEKGIRVSVKFHYRQDCDNNLKEWMNVWMR